MPTSDFIVNDSYPLSTYTESPPATPAHKRRAENNPNDMQNGTGSPENARNENTNDTLDKELQRPAKRLCAIEGDDRRRSAPGNMESSNPHAERARYGSEETESVFLDMGEELERAVAENIEVCSLTRLIQTH